MVLWLGLQSALSALPRHTPCRPDPAPWLVERSSPEFTELRRYAIEHCGRCPVLEACRAYALAACEPVGVWGATTPQDRGMPREYARRPDRKVAS